MYLLNSKVKILFITSLFLLLFSSKTSYVNAQESWAQQKPKQYIEAIGKTYEGQINLEGYGQANTINKIYETSCILTETINGLPCTPANNSNPSEGGGLLKQTTRLVSTLYEYPPASAGEWVADVSRNIGFIQPAHAQGIGFSALSPLLGLWKVMRNISYALIIVLLLVVGLMIMFRAKIDPRTVISIQSALPRIVMTLILITFSYPIAGLLIDLMYLVLFLGISLVGPLITNISGGTAESTAEAVARIQADFANGGGLGRLFASIPDTTKWTGAVLSIISGSLGIAAIGAAAAAGSPVLLIGLGTTLGVTIIFLLIVIAFIFAVIRIFFILLNSYIQILIAVIFAPILLLGQAVPGQAAFSNWIRNLLANLSVFPTTAILIVVADIVSSQFAQFSVVGTLDVSLGPSNWVPPVIGGRGSGFAEMLIPLGFALAIPQLVLTIKKAFGAKPIAPVGGSVAKAFGQPVGILQQTISTLGSIRLLRSQGQGGK